MTSKRSPTTLLMLVLLGTYAFRLIWLDGLNIWGDEAASIWLASQPLKLILTPGQETNPFAYPLLLHFWLPLAGRSVFAIRYLSVLVGFLLIPLAYRIGRDAAGVKIGAFAAILTAFSAFGAAYSQEARMYALAATLCALATAAFIKIVLTAETSDKRWPSRLTRLFALYLLSALAASYAHYYALFILLGHGLFALLRWRKLGRAFYVYLGAVVVMAALFIPWNLAQLKLMAASQALKGIVATTGGLALGALANILRETGVASFIGFTLPGRFDGLALIPAALALIGAVLLIQKRHKKAAALLIPLLAILPFLAAWLASPFFSFFHPRYLLIALPYLLLILAVGLVWLGERFHWTIPALLLAVFIGLNGAAYWRAHNDLDTARGRYGDLMAVIASEGRAGDVILLDNGMQWAIFDYYGVKDLPAITFPLASGWDSTETAEKMAEIAGNYDRAWVVMFGDPVAYDPDLRLEGMLSQIGFRTYHAGFIDSALSLYTFGEQAADRPVDVAFGDIIALTAYGISTDAITPGEALLVSLQWEALAKPDADYTLFLHLIGPDGAVAAQFDGAPLGGSAPTSIWTPGEVYTDQIGLTAPPDVTPGTYALQVGWYLWPSLDHLTTVGGDALTVEEITVIP